MPTALITGANRGIGLATAEVLSQAGYSLILTARNKTTLSQAVKTSPVLSQPPKPIRLETLDVAKPTQAASLTKRLKAAGVQLDLLVNNAGIGGPTPIRSPDTGRWAEVVQTNLTGVFYVTHALLPLVKEGGSILAISSVLGRFGVPGYTAYCASKHGVIGFVRALALELAPQKIRVNAICPGWTDTRMATEGLQDMAKAMKTSQKSARTAAERGVPLGEFLDPAEIGQLVLFLASPACRNMTGQAVTLDGGQVMQ